MDQAEELYSTQKISPQLISQIVDAIRDKSYGSVEIYIENYSVTQITERKITKLNRQRPRNRRFSIMVRRGGNFPSASAQAK